MDSFLNRISDDRGDNNTISNLLWIVLAVVTVFAVGKIIYDAVKKKGEDVAKCINDSNDIFGGASKDCK